MKLIQSVFFGLLIAGSLFGGNPSREVTPSVEPQARAESPVRADADVIPRVAVDQRRPRLIGVLDDADIDDPGGGGFTAGACNCKRICLSGPGCNLAQSGACKALDGGRCEPCTNTSCP